MTGNFTLYEEFFNTETRTGYMDLQDELESITSINGKPDNNTTYRNTQSTVWIFAGKIELSWTLYQPCISEYEIRICTQMGEDICWNGVFKQPRTEKEDHSGYQTTVDLATLEGFDYKLEECQEYEIRLRPLVTNQHGHVWSGPEIFKPFTLIYKLKPPESMTISTLPNI